MCITQCHLPYCGCCATQVSPDLLRGLCGDHWGHPGAEGLVLARRRDHIYAVHQRSRAFSAQPATSAQFQTQPRSEVPTAMKYYTCAIIFRHYCSSTNIHKLLFRKNIDVIKVKLSIVRRFYCQNLLRWGQLSIILTVKVKSSMARSLPVENLLPQNVGSIINYLQ